MGCQHSTAKEPEVVTPVETEPEPQVQVDAQETPEVTVEATDEAPNAEEPATELQEPIVEAEAEAEAEVTDSIQADADVEKQVEAVVEEIEVTKEVEEPLEEIVREEDEQAVPKYTIAGSSMNDDGVVLYHIEVKSTKQTFKRRYSDFKLLRSNLPANESLPELPPADFRTYFERRDSLVQTRQQKFQEFLNAVAEQDEVENSAAFKSFIE